MTKTKPQATTRPVQINEESLISVGINDLVPYENNPRVNDHAVEQMASIIRTHGFRVPVLVRTMPDGRYRVVDGHLRLKAAKRLGMAELPCLVVDDMSDEQIKAFRLSVNKAAELAEWDMTKLRVEVQALKLPPSDLAVLTGFDDRALQALTGDTIKVDKNKAPVSPVSKSADKGVAVGQSDTVTLTLSMTLAQRDAAEIVLEQLRQTHSLPTKSAAFLRILSPHLAEIEAARTEATATQSKTRRRREA
jgi:ParB-like chromosome segregation protein Spo0J